MDKKHLLDDQYDSRCTRSRHRNRGLSAVSSLMSGLWAAWRRQFAVPG